MRSPREAIAEILKQTEPLGEVEEVELGQAAGRVLASEIVSDVDLPPFNKSMMDGFGFAAGASLDGPWDLEVVGESRAGVGFGGSVGRGEAVAIYTGARLPLGVDAVQMVEKTRLERGRVHFEGSVEAGQHVMHLGEVLAKGRGVLARGHCVRAVDLPLLAAVGADPTPVFRRPRISILTTGDELVAPSAVPGPDQIREGNTIFLSAAVERSLGCEVIDVGVVADDLPSLKAAFARALDEGDALITTGGVSMGKYDLVGQALEAIGVEPVLHKVAIKPGKPIWFGRRGAKPVFGLPGNPVSSLLGFEVFVRPALARLAGAGLNEQAERLSIGRWGGPALTARERQMNIPIKVTRSTDGSLKLIPAVYKGSSDVAGLAGAQGFAIIPAHSTAGSGELISWRPFEGCLLS